jgi:hypothetical protein
MRMAAEMRKRMDDAQREFEKNAREQGQRPYRDDDDDEEDYDEKDTGIGKRDAELLEGAEVASIRTTGAGGEGSIRSRAESAASRTSGTGSGRSGTLSRKTTSSTDGVSILDVDNLSLAESKGRQLGAQG